jgi:hypothetical protein
MEDLLYKKNKLQGTRYIRIIKQFDIFLMLLSRIFYKKICKTILAKYKNNTPSLL